MKVIEGNVASPLGFSADGLHAGFKKRKLDFGWIVSEVPASVAGVYTTNKVIAAPLIVTRQSVKKAKKMKVEDKVEMKESFNNRKELIDLL